MAILLADTFSTAAWTGARRAPNQKSETPAKKGDSLRSCRCAGNPLLRLRSEGKGGSGFLIKQSSDSTVNPPDSPFDPIVQAAI